VISLLKRPARVVSIASRRKKIELLTSAIERGSRVLMVGVSMKEGIGSTSVVERGLKDHCEVVALTYEPVEANTLEVPLVRADGRRLPFASGSFDYVVSNAVIEHVGGPVGARQMIAESGRVARRGWLHFTPNRRFLFETHTGVPVLHWLPTRLREPLFAKLGKPFPVEQYCLFTARSLRRLDPSVTVRPATGRFPALTLLASGRSSPG
jgi:Methyltransferase domain